MLFDARFDITRPVLGCSLKRESTRQEESEIIKNSEINE